MTGDLNECAALRRLGGVTIVALTAALIAAPVAAQTGVYEHDWSISIMPRMGIIQPGGAGTVEGWQPEGLRLQGGPVGGVAIEVQTPLSWFAVRGTVDRSLLNNLTFDPQDPNKLALTDPFFGSRAQGLQSQFSLGGVLRPFRNFPVRPTGLFGTGVRHWAFDPGNLAASLVPRFPESQWDRTWHYGAGLEFDAHPFLIRTEVLEYRARAHEDLGAATISDRFLMLSLAWVGGELIAKPEPPWVFLGFLGGAQFSAVAMGAPTLAGWFRASGLLAVGAGFWLHWKAWQQFDQASTTRATLAEPSGLVTGGVFALTRNPMYLAGVIMLVGWAILLGHPVLLIAALMFGGVAEWLWIRPEERLLTDVFGDDYASYRAATRRWI